MNIVLRKVDELINYEKNARVHSAEQISQIADSIKNFGFNDPIEIGKNNILISGHARLQAAKKLGMKEVPTITHDHMTDTQRKAYILAANRIALSSGWDDDLLRIEFEELQTDGLDLSLTGFTDDEIDLLLNPEEINDGLVDEDECGEVDEENVVSALGDVWILGNHRLMCGNSTFIDDVEKLMDGKKADMVFTDPPYNMNFTGGIHADGLKSFNSKHGGIRNDKMKKEDADQFFDDINKMIKIYCKGAFYITFYRLGILDYWNSLERTKLKVRSLIIWNKGNHTLSNSDYMSMYEPIFYGWVDDHNFYGGNNGKDIWDIQRTSKNDLHPTMKPLELVENSLNHGRKQNNLILDLFGGSGTTLIACEKNNRHARLMELDEKYVDVIIKRWQQFTGKEAVHEETGVKFNEKSPR